MLRWDTEDAEIKISVFLFVCLLLQLFVVDVILVLSCFVLFWMFCFPGCACFPHRVSLCSSLTQHGSLAIP